MMYKPTFKKANVNIINFKHEHILYII